MSTLSSRATHRRYADVRSQRLFGPDGARAFADDAPGAEIRLLDGGHFLLGKPPRRRRGLHPPVPGMHPGVPLMAVLAADATT